MRVPATLCSLLLFALSSAADPYSNAVNAIFVEIEYASGLQELGLPEYADMIITRAERLHEALPKKPKSLWERSREIYWGSNPGLAHAGTNQLARWHAHLDEADALLQKGRTVEANKVLMRVISEMGTAPAPAAVDGETEKIDTLLKSVVVPDPEPPAPAPEVRQVEVDHLWPVMAKVEPPGQRRDPVTPDNRDQCPVEFSLVVTTNGATAHFAFSFTEERPVVVGGGRLELFEPDPDILFSPHAREGRVRIPIELDPMPETLPATRRTYFAYPAKRLRNTYLRLWTHEGLEAISLEAFARQPDAHDHHREDEEKDIEINIQL